MITFFFGSSAQFADFTESLHYCGTDCKFSKFLMSIMSRCGFCENIINLTNFQGSFIAMLLTIIGLCFVLPVFYYAGLEPSQKIFIEKKFYCELKAWPMEYRHHYTLITSAAHYFLTFVIVAVLYAAKYYRLKAR